MTRATPAANPATRTQILAVGGGKGGVGKSSVAVGLAVAFAQAGKRTVIVDLDLGAANLHTLLGIKTSTVGVGDYLYAPKSKNLDDYSIETGVDRLRLISGNGFIPGIANLEHQRKARLLKALLRLDYEYVVLDLGAGTSYNVVDFFAATQSGIVVTLPEPTAVLNAYEFLKNVVYRIFTQHFKKRPAVAAFIDSFKTAAGGGAGGSFDALREGVTAVDPKAGRELEVICRAFRPALVLNMARGDSETLGHSLRDICKAYLSITVSFLGAVPHDDAVRLSVTRLKPYLLIFPDSASSAATRDIAGRCLSREWLDERQAGRLDDEAAAPEDEPGEPPAAPGPAPAPGAEPGPESRKQALADQLKGHADSDLSSLVGDFFSAGQLRLDGRERPGTGPDGRPQGPAGGPADASFPAGGGSGLDLKLAPRIDPTIRQPMFAYLAPRPPPSRGFWDWLPFRRGRDALPGAAALSFISQIEKLPQAANVAVAIQFLASRAPATPEVGEAWMRAGIALIERDCTNLAFAQVAFEQAFRCLPDHPRVANNRAASLLAGGVVTPALDVLAAARRLHPDDPTLAFNLAYAHFLEGRFREAAAGFEQAGRPPGDARTQACAFLRAYCLYQAGDFAAAADLFAALAARNPKDLLSGFNSGLASLRAGRLTAAVETFTALVAVAPTDAEALAARGVAYALADNRPEAVVDLGRAIALQPATLSFRIARGVLCHAMGLLDVAITDIQTITQLDPGHTEFQNLLTRIRASLAG